MERRLNPKTGRGHSSAAQIKDDWYVACRSKSLGRTPIARTILGHPLVLFRDDTGKAAALLDRCPHRNVPLSMGRVCGNELECAYHGWRFNAEGTCTRVPSLCGPHVAKGRRVSAWAVREQNGLIWIYGTPDKKPVREPYRFPLVDDRRYTTVYDVQETPGTLHAIAENALDVPHTAFLHGGLFRSDGARSTIAVEIARTAETAEARYFGEARPSGLLGWILAPGGGELEHTDRFILPGITQVEYKLGDRSHLLVSAALTPIDDFQTRLFAVVSFRLPIPHFLIKVMLNPIARKVFQQDKVMLTAQVENIARFGGEQFMSTEVDALGPQILRLLRDAERGERKAPAEEIIRRFSMDV